jgi:hypothetical protein
MSPPTLIPSSDEEIRTVIETLRSLDLSAISIEHVKEGVGIVLKGHVISVPFFDPGIKLYRGRKMMCLPTFLAEIGAPPPDKVLSNQRCNRAGESLFYCSSARNAPFFEIHAQVGDHVVLSEWRTTAQMRVNHIGYTRPTFERLQSTRNAPSWGPPQASPRTSERTRLIDEFFSSFFSVDVLGGQEYFYKATIALTEKFIPEPSEESGFRFDGLMYPTIPMNGNCENFALKLDFVERGVAFVKAEYLVIREIDDMQMKVDVLDFANSVHDGRLTWKGRPGRWTLKNKGDQVQLSVEQGEWVARDLNGNIVSME